MSRKSKEKKSGGRVFFRLPRGIEETCLFIIRWATYLALFAPLIIMKGFFFPFVAPKTIFFRILAEIIFAAYLLLVIFYPRWRPRLTPLTIGISLFLAILVLTSLTGINFERSFWSTFERMTGLFTFFHLFAFFIVAANVFREKKDWEKILAVSILVGVILSLYVLLAGDQLSTRGGGTIGNTSFMATYLLFDIFFALVLFLTERGNWRVFAGASLAIMIPVLMISTGRGAIAAFFLGIFLLKLSYLLFSQKKLLKHLTLGIILALVIFGTVGFIAKPDFLETKVDGLMWEMKPRFAVWQTAWQGWQERFWLGWGPENFNVVFSRYFNPCMFLNECGGEIWFDRSHNIILDTGTTTGIIGLFGYLFIFGIAIFGLLGQCSKKAKEGENILSFLTTAVLLVVYFFQNLLVFDMINSYLVFFLSLAFIDFLIAERKEEVQKSERNYGSPSRSVLAAGVIIAAIFVFWNGNIQPARSAGYIVSITRAPSLEEAGLLFQKSLNSWMEKYEPREHFCQSISRPASHKEQDQKVSQMVFEMSAQEMEKSIKENSLDFRHHLFLGRLYNSFYYFNQNPENLSRAEEVLERAIGLSPTNQQGYWYLAETKMAQGRYDETVNLLKKAVELEPRLATSHWYLAVAYQAGQKYDLALEEVKTAEELGYDYAKNLESIKRVVAIYNAMGEKEKAEELIKRAIEINPELLQ